MGHSWFVLVVQSIFLIQNPSIPCVFKNLIRMGLICVPVTDPLMCISCGFSPVPKFYCINFWSFLELVVVFEFPWVGVFLLLLNFIWSFQPQFSLDLSFFVWPLIYLFQIYIVDSSPCLKLIVNRFKYFSLWYFFLTSLGREYLSLIFVLIFSYCSFGFSFLGIPLVFLWSSINVLLYLPGW